MGMETENKGLIDVRDCPCDGCKAKPCGHPARCAKFTLWLNKTVDAVPVVRCKDCRFWEFSWTATAIKNSHGYCNLEDADGVKVGRWDENFCSYGERKDNG